MIRRLMPTARRRFAALPFVLGILSCLPAAALADMYEPDNSSATAHRIHCCMLGERHAFDTPTDEDWIKFYVPAATPITLEATTVSTHCDVAMTLYRDDGTTVTPGEIDSRLAGFDELHTWPGLFEGVYYARFRNADPANFGSAVTYYMRVRLPIGAGIPIETVDERTIRVKRMGPPGLPGRNANAVLAPSVHPRSWYYRHQIEFPNYAESATTGTYVRIRLATDEESSGTGGQGFPSLSHALFTVETFLSNGATTTPVSFSDPVNITVEYAPYAFPCGDWNDIVGVSNGPSSALSLWVQRDVIEGAGVDFQFVSAPCEVNTAARTVTIREFSGLTGSSGRATYGVVGGHSARSCHWELYR